VEVALALNLTMRLTLEPGWDKNTRRKRANDRAREWLEQPASLPYCLGKSRDRKEILARQCHDNCTFGFCDEQEAEGTIRSDFGEAFCRQQPSSMPSKSQRPPWRSGFLRQRGMRHFWDAITEQAGTRATQERPRSRTTPTGQD
jgi:hypothetical protein